VFHSNRDIKWAIECGKLIVVPPPEFFEAGYDETSIDLHLGPLQMARVWDMRAYKAAASKQHPGREAELDLGNFDWARLSAEFLTEVPPEDGNADPVQRAFRRGDAIVVRPGGFLLWSTWERVGTPKVNPDEAMPQRHPELICFVNAKSTRARTGLVVHFTAPTIHAGWAGNVTLEITNFGEFDFVLRERAAIAQLTVATISSAPDLDLRKSKQQTQDQIDPSGAPPSSKKPKRKRGR
jgi:deoxycytidine triphosphate deaminase